MNAATASDGELARAATQGDLDAFEMLMRRFEDRLYRQALGILYSQADALDVVQDTFIAALDSLHRLQDPDKVGAWLGRAVRNKSLNALRAERRRHEAHARYFETLDPVSPPQAQADRDMDGLLAKLPEKSVQIFHLHYAEGFSLQEIAQRLGVSEAGAKQRLYRVRKFLRREIISSTSPKEGPMPQTAPHKPQRTAMLENVIPILRVQDMQASLRYYTETLGFVENWHTDSYDFAGVSRDNFSIYLSQDGQGCAGTWIWVGVDDIEPLWEEFKRNGAVFRQEPTNYPWAYEMKVEDPDGHVLRFGSAAKDDADF